MGGGGEVPSPLHFLIPLDGLFLSQFLTYVLAKKIQSGAKLKSCEEFGQLQTSKGKSKKLKSVLQLKHYRGVIYILFDCSCENSPNSSCHFRNHKSFFRHFLYRSSVS